MNHFVFSSGEIEMSDTVLGRGAFGEVRIAKWRNIKVAAKFLHTDDDSNDQSLDLELRKEVEVLSQLRHPNLVLFIGICEDSSRDRIGGGNSVILTELLPCSLYDLLEGKPSEGIEKITMELPDIIDIGK
jgi:serine/threonine protein kinase